VRTVEAIQKEIDRTAHRRAELWCATPLSDEDVFTVIRLTDRLRDLWDEKREAAAGDQVTARRRANRDPSPTRIIYGGKDIPERPERRREETKISGDVRARLGLPSVVEERAAASS
jgi:hypothetical protein